MLWLNFKNIDPRLRPIIDAVNEIRRRLGKEPISTLPKGYKGQPSRCPIAQALNGSSSVHVSTVRARVDGQSYHLPAVLHEFIVDFDHGKWPEFDARLD